MQRSGAPGRRAARCVDITTAIAGPVEYRPTPTRRLSGASSRMARETGPRGRRRSPDRRGPGARGGRSSPAACGFMAQEPRPRQAATARSRPRAGGVEPRVGVADERAEVVASGAVTTPRLAVIYRPDARSSHGSARSAARTRSQQASASASFVRGISSTNSSPPVRATTSSERTWRSAAPPRAPARGRRRRGRSGR